MMLLGMGGGSRTPATIPEELTPAEGNWETSYSGTASHELTGTITVTGLPVGLSADTSGGTLTVTGTPT